MKFGSKHRFEADGGVKGQNKHLDFAIKPTFAGGLRCGGLDQKSAERR